MNEWINEMIGYICGGKILLRATTAMNLEDLLLNERNQSQKENAG